MGEGEYTLPEALNAVRVGREASDQWVELGPDGMDPAEFAARRGMIAALEWRKECLERDLTDLKQLSNDPMAVLLRGYIEDVQAALDALKEED